MDFANKLINEKQYNLIENELPFVDIYDKIFLLFFLKSNDKLTTEIKAKVVNSFYKIKSLNTNIMLVSTDKYEELMAHVVLNIICNDYCPSPNDLRIMKGICIFAKNNNRYLLLTILTLVLSELNYPLLFDVKNVTVADFDKYSMLIQKIKGGNI